MSALLAILSNLIFYNVCHCQQSDQGLQCLPFLAVWSGLHCLPFSAGLSGSTLYAILSLISVFTICHSQQSVQGLHHLPFSAVWSKSTLIAISAVWSGSTLIAILSLIRVYTVFTLGSLITVYTICHSFLGVLSRCTLFAILIMVYTVCHSQQSDQLLQCLPFSAVWSGSTSTLFAILSLISVYNFSILS